MASPNAQDFCDWCNGPLSMESVARSRWLGIASEDIWACPTCIEKGRYRTPPVSWFGRAEEWLARDQYVLSATDRIGVLNALNEVLHGPDAIEDWEFQTRMGITRQEANEALRRIAGD